jgi:chitinase
MALDGRLDDVPGEGARAALDRLAVRIPLYGWGFNVAEPCASTKNATNTGGRPPGGDFRRLETLRKQGWKRVWDDETKNPWLLSPDHTAVIGYIAFSMLVRRPRS